MDWQSVVQAMKQKQEAEAAPQGAPAGQNRFQQLANKLAQATAPAPDSNLTGMLNKVSQPIQNALGLGASAEAPKEELTPEKRAAIVAERAQREAAMANQAPAPEQMVAQQTPGNPAQLDPEKEAQLKALQQMMASKQNNLR